MPLALPGVGDQDQAHIDHAGVWPVAAKVNEPDQFGATRRIRRIGCPHDAKHGSAGRGRDCSQIVLGLLIGVAGEIVERSVAG